MGRRRERPYHHGDLRAALLEAAIELIASVGPRGFTLRGVARRAGVSHNAPYRHFRDKDELLAAVAAQGFRELTRAMLDAAASQRTALDRLQRSGLAYVVFALRRPEHFAIMFDTPFPTADYPEGAEAGKEAFETLVRFIEACQQDGSLPPGDTLRRALVAWALVHGIAKLAVAKRLPFQSTAAVLQFAESAIGGSLPALSWTAHRGHEDGEGTRS
ncbi:MAG TPA: TetR/AcrR family transcriptional regulator [bacterium]|nr:TetR/AcrR family transcriptional regulator [bacterium]